MRELLGRLHRGDTDFDFMSRKKLYFTIAALLVGISVLSIAIRQFDLSIEFTGGTFLEAPNSSGLDLGGYRDAVAAVGQGDARLQFVGDDEEGVTLATESLGNEDLDALIEAFADAAGVDSDLVTVDAVGPTFGAEITRRAIQALVVFLLVVAAFISLRYEWKMAVTTLVAVFHDLIVTAGIYSILGFEVTPATVIAVLTILGYSLYDGVVVFDKIDENVHALGEKLTFTEITNLSMNEVLMRSLITVLTTLDPHRHPALRRLVPPRRPTARGLRPRPLRRGRRRHVLFAVPVHPAAGGVEGTGAALAAYAAPGRTPQRRARSGGCRPACLRRRRGRRRTRRHRHLGRGGDAGLRRRGGPPAPPAP